MGDSIATAWESHKPRAGGRKREGNRRGVRSRERALERMGSCRREEEGVRWVWGEANKG